MTVWSHLFQHAKFRPNSSILIHGGTSGIGTTATMLTRAFEQPKFYNSFEQRTSRSEFKIGADVAINYNEDDFVEVVKTY